MRVPRGGQDESSEVGALTVVEQGCASALNGLAPVGAPPVLDAILELDSQGVLRRLVGAEGGRDAVVHDDALDADREGAVRGVRRAIGNRRADGAGGELNSRSLLQPHRLIEAWAEGAGEEGKWKKGRRVALVLQPVDRHKAKEAERLERGPLSRRSRTRACRNSKRLRGAPVAGDEHEVGRVGDGGIAHRVVQLGQDLVRARNGEEAAGGKLGQQA